MTRVTEEVQQSGRILAFPPPDDWDVKPLRYLFESVGGATPSKNNPGYWVGRIPWVSPKDMKSEVIKDSEDHISDSALAESRLALLPPGTVLVVVRGMILVHTIPVAITAVEATINQDMKGLFPRKGVIPEYLALVLRSVSPILFSTIEESGHGTRCLRLDLWRNILVGVPSQQVQRQIVDFVGERSAQIDDLIAKKERMIDLLKEKRQSLVSEAVSKGLDPDVPMKDSGTEWINEIPAHWSVERLKYSITRIEQGWSPQCDNRPAEQEEWGVLKVGCVNGEDFNPEEQKALPSELEPITAYEIRIGDILMSRGNTRELVGSAALVKQVRPRLLLCDLLYRFRSNRRADPEFLVLSLRSPHLRFQIEREATGTSSSMKKVGQETLRELLLFLPSLEEQRDILHRLRPKLDQIDATLAIIHKQIHELHEYRQVLISDAVTGKIDV